MGVGVGAGALGGAREEEGQGLVTNHASGGGKRSDWMPRSCGCGTIVKKQGPQHGQYGSSSIMSSQVAGQQFPVCAVPLVTYPALDAACAGDSASHHPAAEPRAVHAPGG
jgi:hypothetical protein